MKNFDSIQRGINIKWLLDYSKDTQTREIIKDCIIVGGDTRRVEPDMSIERLVFQDLTLYVRKSEIHASLKVLSEIFHENLHFQDITTEDLKGHTVIDLGANIGIFTLKAKLLNPDQKIVCVEPNPLAIELLKKNIEVNKLTNVEIVEKAIGAKDDVLNLRFTEFASTLSGKYLGDLEKSNREWVKKELIKSVDVPQVSLSNLAKIYSGDKFVIKFDIQDMELEVLKNNLEVLKSTEIIILEPHSESKINKTIDLIEENGFELSGRESRTYGDLYFRRK